MQTWLIPVLLLIASNTFMTFAWYGHLHYKSSPLWIVILVSWGIALFEYVLQVPANRIGSNNGLTAGQLKITQELITLVVFAVFSWGYLKQPLSWRYYVAFAMVLGAVILVSWGKTD